MFVFPFERRLHCPRNTVHLNLFIAFMLRALVSLLKENLLVQGLGLPSDVEITPYHRVIFIEEGLVRTYLFHLSFRILVNLLVGVLCRIGSWFMTIIMWKKPERLTNTQINIRLNIEWKRYNRSIWTTSISTIRIRS